MAKKEWTPEERKAFGDKMRAAKAARTNTNTPKQNVLVSNPDPVDHGTPVPADYKELQAQVLELKSYLFDFMRNGAQTQPTGPQATGQGLVGTFEKYILDPTNYPDPTARLAKEPKLSRFAFEINYELEWKVGVTQYETKDKINTKEPKFELQLNRIVMDEETGEPTGGRFVITQGIFHEDPQAALVVAQEQGIDVNDYEEKAFLDEMRYLRFRDWLLEAFYTPLITGRKSNKREMVVNGRLVQYFEVNSEDGQVGMTKTNWDEAPRIKF